MQFIGQRDIAMLDWPWSFIHFLSGTGVGIGLRYWLHVNGVSFWVLGVALLIVWELYERMLRRLEARNSRFIPWYKRYAQGLGLGPETVVNSTGDVLIGAVGMLMVVLLVS